MRKQILLGVLAGVALLALLSETEAQQKPKAYNLPATDLKQQVIWGATCDGPNGTGLAFGGQDQKADERLGKSESKRSEEHAEDDQLKNFDRAPAGAT